MRFPIEHTCALVNSRLPPTHSSQGNQVNATDHATIAVLREIAADGVAAVSTRRLAEMIGRGRATAAKSLLRHMEQGRIERTGGAGGVQMGRYRVLPEETANLRKSETTMTVPEPRLSIVPDVFRSPALYGAGRLHAAAPKGVALTVSEIMALGVTRSRRGVTDQLSKLESLTVPLAISHEDSSHLQRSLWIFQELTAEAEADILQHLDGLAPQHRPRYRLDQEALHLHEQEGYRWQLGLEPYSVIADRDIRPHVIEDPFTGCLLFQGALNNSGYGQVHAAYFGIGAHRVAWVAERGPVPAGKELHHLCEQRRCVNVNHLQVVTKAEHTAITWARPGGQPIEASKPVVNKTC